MYSQFYKKEKSNDLFYSVMNFSACQPRPGEGGGEGSPPVKLDRQFHLNIAMERCIPSRK
ncbi:hypothetical protein F7725_002062 [Dissostichus mawsoni]|uniref:Uncharacterized protein n=1 Tax=Dissostichus mawsoni TaxID=36200 RepID=A0A7J5Y2D2_DISMA|nr:hypothetical protein F7725_002062 [Dissostichus mawsoni]